MQRCLIVDVIGQNTAGIPTAMLLNATPETLIKNHTAAQYCRKSIQLAHETGEPISIKIPITIENQTIDEIIHFERGTRYDDHNTVIAYTTRKGETVEPKYHSKYI